MTIKKLKEIIKDLPDDMEVFGYKGGNGDLHSVSIYTTDKYEGEEEKKQRLEKGIPVSLTIDVD
jgi:hypothetical protein